MSRRPMLPPCTAVAPCWTKTSSTRGSTSLQGSKACLWCSSYSSCWGTCSLPESCYTYTHRVIACCLIAGLFTNLVFRRNIASQTIARLKDVARRISNYLEAEHVSKERSASLDLLLRFQRLLVSKLYLGVNGTENVNGYSKSCVSSL